MQHRGWSPRRLVAGLVGGLVTAAAAAAPITWEYDLAVKRPATSGLWTASTAVAADATAYIVSYSIDEMLVDARLGLAVVRDLDVTEELPAEFRMGTQLCDGPLPVLVIDDRVANPEPPEEPGFAADMQIGVNAAGQGFFALDNVVLSFMDTEFGGVPITVELTKIRFTGTVGAQVAPRVLTSPDELTIAETEQAGFDVWLDSPPTENVVVTIARASGDEDLAVVSGAELIFTPTDWDVPQTVTIAAQPDEDAAIGTATFECRAEMHAAASVRVFEGEADCNNNGVVDQIETQDGTAADCNGDGVPDECQADSDNDGVIDPCDECPDDPRKTTPGACGCGNPEQEDCGAALEDPNVPPDDDSAFNDPNTTVNDPNATTTDPNAATNPDAGNSSNSDDDSDGADSPSDGNNPNEAAQRTPTEIGPNDPIQTAAAPPLLGWLLPLCGLGVAIWGSLTAVGLIGLKFYWRHS